MKMDIDDFIAEMQEHQDDDDEPMCSICTEPTEMVDTLNISWCAGHSFRGEFVNAMAQRGYPGLRFHCYAVMQGAAYTVIAATQGSDEMIGLAQAAIEMGDCFMEVA